MIKKTILLNAPPEEIFDFWTNSKKAEKFFAPKCEIENRLNGKYHILFLLDNPLGEQGSEDCKILTLIENKEISFSWNAPPEFNELRKKHTKVKISLKKLNINMCELELSHQNFGETNDWEKVQDYFYVAWDIVLGRLKYIIENSTEIDWKNPYRPEI